MLTTLEDIFITTQIIFLSQKIQFHLSKTEKESKFRTIPFGSRGIGIAGRLVRPWGRMGLWHVHSAHEQRKNSRGTIEPAGKNATRREYATRREKGIEHSRTMKTNPFGGNQITTKQEPVNYINTRGCANYSINQNTQRGRGARGRPFQRWSQNNRGQPRATNTGNQKQCYKCGNQYNQNHLQTCPAKDKICAKCAKRGHFAKVCRSTQVNYLEDTQIDQQEELDTESLETENDRVAFAEFSSSNGWDNYQIDNFLVMAIEESFEIKNTITLIEDDLNGHIVKLKTNSEQLFAIADSGSPMSFLNEETARRLQQKDKSALFKTILSGDTARKLACYNCETIVPKGRLIITIESGGWQIRAAPFIVVDDKKASTDRHQIDSRTENRKGTCYIRTRRVGPSDKTMVRRQLRTIVRTYRKIQKSHYENTVHWRIWTSSTEG